MNVSIVNTETCNNLFLFSHIHAAQKARIIHYSKYSMKDITVC